MAKGIDQRRAFSRNSSWLPGQNQYRETHKEEVLNWSYLNLLGEEIFAGNIVYEALIRPFEELIQNNISRGNSEQVNYSQIFSKLKIKGYPYGYDLLNNTFVNTIEKNIIDSAKSVRAILWNSITMVSMIITTE